MKYRILKGMFQKGGIWKKVCIHYLEHKENGPWRSQTLRRIYKEIDHLEVGIGSYGWNSGLIDGPCVIGNYTSIGPGVRRMSVNHLITGLSTHPCYFNPIYGWCDEDIRTRTQLSIGHDVWIGANAIILPSCSSIGNGSVIGAGAIVTKDVPPFAIVAGVPARVIRYRFSKELCARIENTKWWDFSEDILKNYVKQFHDPAEFCEVFEKDLRRVADEEE